VEIGKKPRLKLRNQKKHLNDKDIKIHVLQEELPLVRKIGMQSTMDGNKPQPKPRERVKGGWQQGRMAQCQRCWIRSSTRNPKE
jgi:hypothetical protein